MGAGGGGGCIHGVILGHIVYKHVVAGLKVVYLLIAHNHATRPFIFSKHAPIFLRSYYLFRLIYGMWFHFFP